MQEDQRRKLRHDILGCLNSIKLSMEVVRLSEQSVETSQFLDCIDSEVDKIQQMLSGLVPSRAENSPNEV